MAKAVIMPALGMAQDTGLIISWLKREGDQIEVGDILMEVETDKATAEIEAEAAGILTNVTAFAGDDVPVAETIAYILAPGEPLPAEAAQQWRASGIMRDGPDLPDRKTVPPPSAIPPHMPTPVAARMAQEHNLDLSSVKPDGGKVTKQDIHSYLSAQNGTHRYRLSPASPLARRLASENQIDLATLSGTGPDGAVLAADVETAAAGQKPIPDTTTISAEESPPLSSAWRTMATRLAEAWATVPHFYLRREVDCTNLLAWWEIAKKQTDGRATITDLLIKAVSAALKEHPRVNASWLGETIIYNQAINMGLAVAVEDGLLVPVIQNSDQRALSEIADARQGIVSRALEGKPKLQDLQGGTFTISNLGMFGVDDFSAIVNPPNAAILAVGQITDRVVPVNGEIVIRPMMILTASFDHRVVDGARGARFLKSLVTFLEEPLSIL